MKSSVLAGRFFQTRLRIHYSWILAIILISWAVSTQYSVEYPVSQRIIAGLGASVLFFFAIVVRELLLVVMAAYKGVDVKTVTLFIFGGLFMVDQKTTSPSHELILSLTGFFTNLIIATLFYFTSVFLGEADTLLYVITRWLAFLFFTLSLFHILPGYPLEGGRALRAILWRLLDDGDKAMKITSWISWFLGVLLSLAGVAFLFLTPERFLGSFLIFTGLILQNAATHSRRELHAYSGTGDRD